jgi:alpha-D-xyloside xylohydrolase
MMAVLRGGLSFGLSGGPFWSQDIGGFQGTKPEPWLYVRWAQWGMFNSHSRCHGVQPREPWEFGAEAEAIFRRYAELRYRLLPYIWSVAHEASRTGLPVMRPLVLEFQDDPTTWHVDTEYLFGPWLLVIPIFDETGLATYYLPPGKWLDYWHDRVLTGPTWRTETFPLEEMPVFVRDGALIGKAPLMQYVGQRPWDELGLEVFLTGGRSQTLLVDDRGQEISVEGWRSGNRAGLRWSGSGVPVEILWRDLAGPAAVELRGEKLPEHLERVGIRWEYDPKLRRLTIHVPAGHDAWELEIRFE